MEAEWFVGGRAITGSGPGCVFFGGGGYVSLPGTLLLLTKFDRVC